jgi:hypothetical protein
LFQPGYPGNANAGSFGQFFAAQTRCAAATCCLDRWWQALSVSANESAKKAARIGSGHGAFYTRIKSHLVPVKRWEHTILVTLAPLLSFYSGVHHDEYRSP